MEPVIWVLVGVVGVMLLVFLFRSARGVRPAPRRAGVGGADRIGGSIRPRSSMPTRNVPKCRRFTRARRA